MNRSEFQQLAEQKIIFLALITNILFIKIPLHYYYAGNIVEITIYELHIILFVQNRKNKLIMYQVENNTIFYLQHLGH